MTNLDVDPVPGPTWTRKRLIGMLVDCYGPAPRGGVNVAAVAEYVGVTPATVRRWVAGGPGHRGRHAPIPARRLAQLQRGPELVERRNQQQFEYAVNAVEAVARGEGIAPAWRTQKWLDPHDVVVLALRGKPWHQVVVTNGSRRASTEMARRGDKVAVATVATRFHAQLLSHAVMVRQLYWRVHPVPAMLDRGSTQVWMDDAPPVDLVALAKAAATAAGLII